MKVQDRASGSFHQVRIDTWKSIARYLGRSSRTVQRWHREYGLPVHRLGVDTGSIFAYGGELDSWLRNRDRPSKSSLVEMPKQALELAPHESFESDSRARIPILSPLIASRKAHSAALVAFARRQWETLSSENLTLIARCCREASDLDPGNVEAYAGLSHALIAQGLLGNLRVPGAYLSAKAALGRAMEVDPELPEVKCARASLMMLLERDWQGARRYFEECLSLDSADTRAIVGRALLYVAEGCPRKASELLGHAVEHCTLNAPATALYCWSRYLTEDFGDALTLVEEARASGQSGPVLDVVEAFLCIHCEKPLSYFPRIENLIADSSRHDLLRGILGYALALNGRHQLATEILETLTHTSAAEKAPAPYAIALVLTGLNEPHDAVQWLELSYRNRSLWSLGIPCDPILKSLRDTPSYRSFLTRANYPAPVRHGQMNEGLSGVSAQRPQATSA